MAATGVAGAEPITAANWQRHPAIVEIRAIYQEIKHAEKTGRLRKEEDACERTLYSDAKGSVRRYRVVRGSDDSAVDASYYYDRDGALRLGFAKAGAVNGTHYEYRIYLSKSGERLWQER